MQPKRISPLADLLTMAIIFLAATLIAAVCLVALKPLFSEEGGAWLTLVAYLVQFGIAIGSALAWYRWRDRESPAGWNPPRFSFYWYNAPLTLGGLILLTAASIAIEPLLELFPDTMFDRLNDAIGRGGVTITLLVIIAPVFEELFFRGIVLEQTRRRWGAIPAVVVSSIFFGLVHMPVWPQVVNAVLMGFLLGYLYVICGSLVPVIIVHAANNAIAYLILEVTGTQNTGFRELIANDTLYWVVYSLCAAITAGSLVWMALSVRSTSEKSNKTDQIPLHENE